ncbi:MAG TPA: hypothetical protein VIV40_10390 [Kofleriaceae bacterium]
MIRHCLLVVALLCGVARAQPGAEVQAGAPGEVAATPTSEANLDQAIAKAQAQQPSLETVARGTFRRARRAISIGPTVGLWTAAIIDPGNIDAALTFGIGFETFKVPVIPSMETLQTMINERVKAQLKDRVAQVFKGQPPDPIALDALVLQVYDEVRKEILGLENVRAKTMERPQFTVGFEANRLFGAERWIGRTRVGIGVWKFTLGLSAAVGRVCRGGTCDDGVKGFIGPEVVLHFLTSKNPRASVVDAFLRADFQANGRGVETYDQLVVGARFLLDLI